jgi:glycosyltransferase involved in cell wall biosynthesis
VVAVAIDATPLLGARTGIGVVVAGFAGELAGHRELDLVGYGLTTRGWRQLPGSLPREVRPARGPMPAGALLRLWRLLNVPPGEWWTGPVDLLHGTNFVVPPSRRAARVVSVWDLTAVHHPEWCTATARRYPALIRREVGTGAWVHTGSHSVAAEIIDVFGANPERVRVVSPGVRVRTPDVRAPGPPYVLALGTTEPRKDLPGLVAAFDLIASGQPELRLHIVGPSGWGEPQLQAAIAGSAHRDRIRRIGWVRDAATQIAGAAVLAYPSRYEGFGLPPLEAMSLGVPVVATAVGSLPEVLGDAAELVAPGRPDALAASLDRVLADSAVRTGLVQAGRARAAQFSWAASGAALVSLYRDALRSR